MGLKARKPVFWGLRTTERQTSLHSLITSFIIHLLESISRLAMREISIFLLVSVAEQAGFNHPLLETPEDRFSCVAAHIVQSFDTYHLLTVFIWNFHLASNVNMTFTQQPFRMMIPYSPI